MDPKKRDYVVVNGSPVPSDRVLEKCYFALAVPLGQWLHGEVGQGSLLFTLKNQKRTSDIEQRYAAYARDAIRTQVIEPGAATEVQVRNVEATRTGTSNQIQVIPSQQQLSAQIAFVPVGG
jgi:phage gp46-like protein